ncbi:hypothetical protein DFP72DRAFT_873803 [Ephemerocybe angulata]|uniref:L-ornithine N(5)-monooxygenase [NAD(P)H] n=1 Tax=Ephemerocybe angulata TaxID=980116 RepID=A0A8H6MFF6_9AGAR|nr:hypothetical protein DFP72DRAFT_873803 [Tulosesus angulatus]
MPGTSALKSGGGSEGGRGRSSGTRQAHVVIVGAGIAGLAIAIRLKKDLNFHNFTIFERASTVGGTWRDNTYPGCGCDIPGHWYSLSSDLNPNWKECYPTQPDLYDYWVGLWHKHGLEKHTRLNTRVDLAKWDNERQMYDIDVVTEGVKEGGGGRETVEAEILFYAVGGFQDPKFPPELGGLETFKGDLFHSARWRHDVELKGKRVGVIGNGCSAAQFIPVISTDPSVEIINFARTPQWFVSRSNYTYSPWMKWVFANIPGVMRAHRNWIMFRSDIRFFLFDKKNAWVLKITREVLTQTIRSKAPKKYVDKLIPSYDPGCKRMIMDAGYLECLGQPNVSLRWDAIDSVVEEGIRLKSGEIVPLDVIIFGTGYSLVAAQLNVVGAEGTTVQDYFKKKGVPTAYLGSCFPGFPNLFTTLGPNVAAGHASIIFGHEAQIQHALQLIKPVLDGSAKSFEVTHEATDEYNAWLDKRLSTAVWSDCLSYYNELDGKKVKNFVNFPGPVALFWWLCRSPRWSAFRAVGAEAWERQRLFSWYRRVGLWTLIMSVVVALASTAIKF